MESNTFVQSYNLIIAREINDNESETFSIESVASYFFVL